MIDVPTSLLYLGADAVATLAGHVVVRWVLRLCPLPNNEGYQGLRRAGTVIGILERLFTVTLVILGQYAAITILFAAKSIVRFGETKERHFAEYYLIGTLASILFALLTAQAALKLATLLRL
ncbi:MAG: hypothetical protein NTX53_21510 [candidate division WOR-3 bacterium]|nr:hypothetical protein [candidate division WOR-3 bacterium]